MALPSASMQDIVFLLIDFLTTLAIVVPPSSTTGHTSVSAIFTAGTPHTFPCELEYICPRIPNRFDKGRTVAPGFFAANHPTNLSDLTNYGKWQGSVRP